MPSASSEKDGSIRELDLPDGSIPEQIAAGPGGTMWFTAHGASAIGRIGPSGHVRTFATPTPASGPFDIAAGPDGNMWFTESAANTIGRITPAGHITEFGLDPGFNVEGIAAGPDGAMWFTRFSNPDLPYPGFIGRITMTGSWTEVPSDGVGDPLGIAAGPDGNLWVTGPANDVVARVTTGFAITAYRVPGGALNVPYLIAAGPDGAMWFTENGSSESPRNVGGNKIGRITMTGRIRQFRVPTESSEPSAIAAGPQGTIWFAEQAGNKLGRIDAAG
jgi:virginiamycin B lyase